jgi:hypothetical protein
MSDSRMDQTLLRLFREAFDEQEIPDDGHFVEDYHLLSRWSAGLLEPGEHERIIEHLAACPECREVVGVMLDTGALDLPEVTEDRTGEPAAPTSGWERRLSRRPLLPFLMPRPASRPWYPRPGVRPASGPWPAS